MLGRLAEILGDVGDRGRHIVGGRQAIAGGEHPQLDLLDAARRADGPAEVTEVAADLPADGGHREGQEVTIVAGLEPMNGRHQTDVRDLLEVLTRDPPVAELGGDAARHPEVGQHDLGAGGVSLGRVGGRGGDVQELVREALALVRDG